ncbi:ABC transporter substrate-binding protein [Streptomyces lateritius]|uniref:ABC transporter substrate-binding protein n=1 Tax=Streptomyces lateritius TaxID=67313 RepID=UPI001C8C3455|nr:ABC transporter substrate-binding protein [Streptomyces lateritius]MBX9421340.1 ABC transporter substrate-binding protein [Streptomyces lateritius]
MNVPSVRTAAERSDTSAVRIGALVPLSPPGWVEAGRHLRAGLEAAVGDVNDSGGIGGRPLDLVVRDTAADPRRAAAAMEELAGLGVAAVAGEYHSVVARAAAAGADALRLPFLCSSAVLDALTEEPTDWVARLAPPQSHGWRLYADFLLGAGHRRIAVAAEPSVYWASGTRVLRDRLATRGGTVIELDARALTPTDVCDALVTHRATALLLLTGFPEPAVSIVKAVRADRRLTGRETGTGAEIGTGAEGTGAGTGGGAENSGPATGGATGILIGAPAGQPEFAAWSGSLGDDGAAVPFLRYLPGHLSPLGVRVDQALRERLAAPPSFVAFEGYDTVTVLADMLRRHGTDRAGIAASWSQVTVEGTRGRIQFTRVPGISVWQAARTPIQVADRDPAAPGRFRVLHAT